MDLPAFKAKLLYNRGIRDVASAADYLNSDLYVTHDPMLLPDMNKAIDRLRSALSSRERIGIFGDFDADGLTGTALLYRALADLGCDVSTYIPHRVEEGHGLSTVAIDKLKSEGVSLLITVDCGVTSINEVDIANARGLDTIITDHHTPLPQYPAACAVVDPLLATNIYPFRHLTGVGLAYKLAQAMYASVGKVEPKHLLDLVAIGTIADVGPLVGENRHLVKEGLNVLNKTSNAGIRALLSDGNPSGNVGVVNAETLSFGVIPKLNVAGRLGHASTSLDLLTTKDDSHARKLAKVLNRQNQMRQKLTEEGVEEAIGQICNNFVKDDLPGILIVGSKNWIPGILGLIAGRLCELYYRPTIALCIGESLSRASARSIPEFDIIKALRGIEGVLTKFGGHPRAAGFTIPTSNIGSMRSQLQYLTERWDTSVDLTPSIEIDCELSPGMLDTESVQFLDCMAPFGEGNGSPVFLGRRISLIEARKVGDGKHLKMSLADLGHRFDAIAFRQGQRFSELKDSLDLVYRVGFNHWRGRRSLQLTVLDFRVPKLH